MQTFLLYPDKISCTIEELQTHLQFRYVPQIAFESLEEEQEIRSRGVDKWKEGKVTAESEELGKRFIDKIREAYIPNVSIRWINDKIEYGLFVEEEIPEGSYVGEYTGVVRRNDRRHFEPLNNYCYEYPVPDEIGRSFVIDATQGHLTRFINHSFAPNLKPIHIFYDGFYHLIFLSLCAIEKGMQLTFNYGKNYWYIREPPSEL